MHHSYFLIPGKVEHKISNEYIYVEIKCGWCGKTVHARMAYCVDFPNGQSMAYVTCPCELGSIVTMTGGRRVAISQLPTGKDFNGKGNWPTDIQKLYGEAAICYAHGAYTACAMMCRKTLMGIACDHGEADGQTFAAYVTIITDKILVMPKAKATVDAIRTIGNDANHDIDFIDKVRAEKALQILTYIANAIYDMPSP